MSYNETTLNAVRSQTTVENSMRELLQGIAAEIKASGLSVADQAKVDTILAPIQSDSVRMAGAITDNTPFAVNAATPINTANPATYVNPANPLGRGARMPEPAFAAHR
jgi:hypothetical protein